MTGFLEVGFVSALVIYRDSAISAVSLSSASHVMEGFLQVWSSSIQAVYTTTTRLPGDLGDFSLRVLVDGFNCRHSFLSVWDGTISTWGYGCSGLNLLFLASEG